MKIREKFTCPLELILDFIKGKWKPIIIWRLRTGPKQLTNLNKEIIGINQKMLIEHLNQLLETGIIHKEVYEGYPLKVEYSLTEFGFKILKGIRAFQEIGIEYIENHEELNLDPNFYRELAASNEKQKNNKKN